jgi:hypothetical protein
MVKVCLHLSGNIMREHDEKKNFLEERVNVAKFLKKQGVSQFRIVQILNISEYKAKQLVALLLIVTVMTVFTGKTMASDDFAATVYGGRMTDGVFEEALPGLAEFIDAYVVVGALSWTFSRYFENALSFELEGQIGKWFGDQHNLEFNLPMVMRWSKFPWNNYVSTSLAFGLGPSYASKEPAAEIDRGDSTQKFLAYWFAEMAFGPPDSNWAGVFRIHHRSGAFGLIADRHEGGSNTLAVGLKYRF